MTTATKTLIQASWAPTKIQTETAEAFARNMGLTMTVLSKFGPEAIKEFEVASTKQKVEQIKKAGAKTPIEVVKVMAEIETNLFGSKIYVYGDEKQASMEYEVCGCYNAMQKTGIVTETNKEEIGKNWSECLNRTAKELGFAKAEVKFSDAAPCAVVTYTK